MRVKIKNVVNPDNAHMIGMEIDTLGTHYTKDGKFGVQFIYKGRKHFLEHKMYEIVPGCAHDFVKTGMLRTWCKKCDVDAYYEMGNIIIDRKKSIQDEEEGLFPFLD